jgi:hypothetical protein
MNQSQSQIKVNPKPMAIPANFPFANLSVAPKIINKKKHD